MIINSRFPALFQEIKARQEDFMRAFNAGDAKGAAEVYDPDGEFFELKNFFWLNF